MLNVLNVWFRDISPTAIKNEPEEDNGFYPSPQHKAPRRKSEDEESVSLVFNSCTSLTCDSILWCMWLACLLADSSISPRKSRWSMIKSQRKGNKSMKKKKMTMRRRYFCFFLCLCLHFRDAWGLFFKICSLLFQDIKPKKKKKDKNVIEGKKCKKDEEKWKWFDHFSW